jgi:starch synthase
MYPYYAHGLDGILSSNAWKLTGITHGIDTGVFNPETDKALPAHYNADSFVEGKAACKAALQAEVGLPQWADVPLMVMVTRLAEHKGLDLLTYAARQVMQEENCQLIVLGTGESRYEEFFRALAREFPDRVSAQITFDLGLASRMYAGADIYLMPSKSEPCGLSQMNAMRYGTVPVVHATGGLRDTVPAADDNGEGGLGFTFESYNGDDFRRALGRCLALYRDNPQGFRALQHREMSQDFSWDKPAGRYMDLFHQMLSR